MTGTNASGTAFEMTYDKLLVATGARPAVPGFAQKPLSGVMALKNLEQGRMIKAYIKARSVKKVLIIGMGYIALEMSEALSAREISVTMVKPRPRLLPWMARDLADIVRKELETNGVELLDGHEIQAIESIPGNGLQTITGQKKLNPTWCWWQPVLFPTVRSQPMPD